MSFEEAIENVKKEYNVRFAHKNSIIIETNQMLDESSFCFVSLLNYHDKLILTDLTNNMEHISLNVEQVKKICEKHNITFDDYNIECEYTSNQDIKRYLECLKDITNKLNK